MPLPGASCCLEGHKPLGVCFVKIKIYGASCPPTRTAQAWEPSSALKSPHPQMRSNLQGNNFCLLLLFLNLKKCLSRELFFVKYLKWYYVVPSLVEALKESFLKDGLDSLLPSMNELITYPLVPIFQTNVPLLLSAFLTGRKQLGISRGTGGCC